MASYGDSRYSYEHAALRYGGVLVAGLLSGSQPAPAGGDAVRGHGSFHRSLAGVQPFATAYGYEEPAITYESPFLLYEFAAAGYLTRLLRAYRRPLGAQPSALGILTWARRPNIDALYTWSFDGKLRGTEYLTGVVGVDDNVAYAHDIRGAHSDPDEEIVYRAAAPRTYTRS